MDRIFRTSGLMRPKWDRKQAGSTYGAISIRNTVNTCASVYIPVNAQDIVDEEFANLDSDDKEAERPPDISKLTLSLEEMAPHTNPRYGRDEIGLGNMFAEFFSSLSHGTTVNAASGLSMMELSGNRTWRTLRWQSLRNIWQISCICLH